MDALVVHSLVVRLPRERRAGGRVPFDLSELAIQTAALAAFVALCLLPGPALIRLSFPARLCLWLYASAVDRRPCVTPRDAKRRDSPLARGRSGYLRIGPLETISAGIWCLVGCMEKGDAEKATRGLALRGGAAAQNPRPRDLLPSIQVDTTLYHCEYHYRHLSQRIHVLYC